MPSIFALSLSFTLTVNAVFEPTKSRITDCFMQQMRVFVVNSEDAKVVSEYINSHIDQV